MATSNLVQYIVLRTDLNRVLQWPFGALIAQAAHASTAATHLFYEDPNTKAYLSDLDRMHKVVLEVPDENTLRKLAEKLEAEKIDHKLWIEQPENIPTCLVSKPYPKNEVQSYFRHLKLLKNL